MKPVTLNPDALTRLLRDLYVGNVELNVQIRSRDSERGVQLSTLHLKIEAIGRELFGGSLTLHQLLKIARGEARLVVRMGADDTASWLAYDETEDSNIRKRILGFLGENYARNGGGLYWGEIAGNLALVDRDRIVLYDLERERLVESTTSQSARYVITTAGRVALVEGRS